jgi:sulfate permease, SulP family
MDGSLVICRSSPGCRPTSDPGCASMELTVWAVIVPEAVAYSQLAGVPPQAGLFAAPFLLLGYVLFGTSRQLMVGATSTSAIMMAGTVAAIAGSDPKKYAALMVGLTLTTRRPGRSLATSGVPMAGPCWSVS